MRKLLETKVEGKQLNEAIARIMSNEASSKSNKMKELFDLGLEVKEITDIMGVRYNFVYNVISNYVNMNGLTIVQSEKSGKKDQIIEMYLAGKSNKEISIDLKTNYNYVHNVIKKYKAENPDTKTEDANA